MTNGFCTTREPVRRGSLLTYSARINVIRGRRNAKSATARSGDKVGRLILREQKKDRPERERERERERETEARGEREKVAHPAPVQSWMPRSVLSYTSRFFRGKHTGYAHADHPLGQKVCAERQQKKQKKKKLRKNKIFAASRKLRFASFPLFHPHLSVSLSLFLLFFFGIHFCSCPSSDGCCLF